MNHDEIVDQLMAYTPDYKDLYEGQQKFIAELQDVIQELTHGLRDKMAMAALSGLCGMNWSTRTVDNPTPKDHVVQSYVYADAMLKIREVKG